MLCVLVHHTLAGAVPLRITGRQKGRIDCKWKRTKLRVNAHGILGSAVRMLIFWHSLERGWEAVLHFSAFPHNLYSFTLIQCLLFHRKSCLPPSCRCHLLILQAPGFSFIEDLTLLTIFHATSISASHIGIHVDDPPSSYPSLKAS